MIDVRITDRLSVNAESLVGFFCVTGGVAFATATFLVTGGRSEPWQISLLYLPVVVVCAIRFGFATAVWGAVLSFLCWDYFLLSPVYRLNISSSRDFIALVVFLTVAITTSRLASGARQQAVEAEARAGEARMLYMVSQVIGREIDAAHLLETLAAEVVRLCGSEACAILRCRPTLDGVSVVTIATAHQSKFTDKILIEQIAQRVLLEQADAAAYRQIGENNSITKPLVAPVRIEGEGGGTYLPLYVDSGMLGLMYVGYRLDGAKFSFQDERLILTLGSQAAVVMARDRLTEEATKQAQKVAILGERNRLAKEVHDTLSHAFTGIRFLLEAAAVSGQEELPGLISQARQLAIDGAQEARRSVWALRPVALEDGGGIVKAIRTLMQQQTDRTSISGRLEVVGDERLLSSDEEDNLLRICQEALTNIIRHSHATAVVIKITFEPTQLSLTITDNGCGFAGHDSDGFGIGNMRERSQMIGAEFGVRSEIGSGTEVLVHISSK